MAVCYAVDIGQSCYILVIGHWAIATASGDEVGLRNNVQMWGRVYGQQQRESGQGQPLPEPLGSQE